MLVHSITGVDYSCIQVSGEKMWRAVSMSVSPLTMLLSFAERLSVSALSRLAAISKDVFVLVLGS